MKIRNFALAALLAVSAGAAVAQPTLQTCASMELAHVGELGVSYRLACDAGQWHLTYSGSLPAGTDPTTIQYQLTVQNGDGARFTLNRTVGVPSPAQLGQMLVREAVQLDNGNLALRDCKAYNCTLYRPLEAKGALVKAAVTVSPDVKRLQDERAQLLDSIAQRTAELTALKKDVEELRAQLQVAKAALEAERATAAASTRDKQTQVAVSRPQAAKPEQVDQAKLAELTRQNAELTESLASVKRQLEAVVRVASDKAFYQSTAADMVALHNAQIAVFKKAMPDVKVDGILYPMTLPENVKAATAVVPDAAPGACEVRPAHAASVASVASVEKSHRHNKRPPTYTGSHMQSP